MWKTAGVAGVTLAVALAAVMAAGDRHDAHAQTATKQLVVVYGSNYSATGSIGSVSIVQQSTNPTLLVRISAANAVGPIVCNYAVNGMDEALQMRAQIISDKTTRITCRNLANPTSFVNVPPPSGATGLSFEIDGNP